MIEDVKFATKRKSDWIGWDSSLFTMECKITSGVESMDKHEHFQCKNEALSGEAARNGVKTITAVGRKQGGKDLWAEPVEPFVKKAGSSGMYSDQRSWMTFDLA